MANVDTGDLADPNSTHGMAQAGPAKQEHLLVHVLGFINVDGEDGARHAVPILAAPGLRVEPSRQSSTLAATQAGSHPRRAPGSRRAEEIQQPGIASHRQVSLPLSGGRSVAIPLDMVSVIAQSQTVY
jgi:hypothetical protein